MDTTPGQRIHFIGIGGVSMSALALTLAARGYLVSGSDRDESDRLRALREAGVTVTVGHRAANVGRADGYVYTTAVRDDNPELVAARNTGKPVWHRSELLADLLTNHRAVAVTGAHGKSTTTAMLGLALLRQGCDPTVYVGGDVSELGGAHRIGRGDLLTFEACESDGSFLRYRNCSQVLTNVEPDHLDQHGTFERLQKSYAAFVASADPSGFLAYNADDAVAARLAADSPARLIGFGLSAGAEVAATAICPEGRRIRFDCLVDGRLLRTVTLRMPGRHNVMNALAVTAAVVGLGLDPAAACGALEDFGGVGRRFEELGEVNGASVVHDYAHHPTEVRAVLRAAREAHGGELVAAFQPHLYSRTQHFMDDFAEAFDDADVVAVADIYAAREQPIPGVSSEVLAERIAARPGHRLARWVGGCEQMVTFLREIAAPGQLILVIGAGDILQVAHALTGPDDASVTSAREGARSR